MKILQFIYELVPGGAERFVVDLSNELAKNNKVALYTLRDDSIGNKGFYVPEIDKKVVYNNLKIRPGFKPSLILKFYKILRQEKPDVVHCHLNLVNYFFILSVLFHKNVRFIYTIHNTAENEVSSWIEKIIRRFFFRHRFFIPVSISDETKISYKNFYKIKEVELIYNGRSHSAKSENYESVVCEIEAFKPTRNTLVFCHPSRYNENQKNQKMLVSVFNKLREEGIDLILLIMGEDFEQAHELKNIAGDHIHFLGIRSNVTDYLYASDAFCLSSNFEGMPISLIEAFACGCIPICTPVGGCLNAIKHGVTGFLSESVSERDYHAVFHEFIRRRSEINTDNLISHFESNFSIELCTARYTELYKT